MLVAAHSGTLEKTAAHLLFSALNTYRLLFLSLSTQKGRQSMGSSDVAPAEGEASMPKDLSLAISVQQNLKLCAAAVGQMRQEAIAHRKLADGMPSRAHELREAQAENERLKRIHDATRCRLQTMQEEMEELQQLTRLLIASRTGQAGAEY
ncbi:hypothetical protein KFL_001240220 [Klebsormidium nitens]|uniref:Uncharacterized protein n=1 Tax=Klebsormidium nitens TaxID=105231 RepID=A0A1Y1I0W0_KLENI|nr:hypothetical protein KFL_001240220 [Klebsormidium nitens]|eukprot:GAQ82791.1 hypothetical protein KFL_001240220 [Klebsormidium nitens]